MNSRRTMGSRPDVGSSSTRSPSPGQTAGDGAHLGSLAFRKTSGALRWIKLERSKQLLLRLPVSSWREISKVIQGSRTLHPTDRMHLVRHRRRGGASLHSCLAGSRTEDAHLPALRTEQISRHFMVSSCPRRLRPEESVTAAGCTVRLSHGPPLPGP